MTPIDSFSGPFRFLSNFYPCEVEFEGVLYPSSEHAFVAAKTLDPKQRDLARRMPSCGEVKRFGRKLALREDWEDVRVGVMLEIVLDKFARNTELAKCLLATGDAELIEGNHWGDTFWGVCEGEGENYLGRILMEVRRRLAPIIVDGPPGS